MINDPQIRVILLQGLQGIGKSSLANEALRRFFEGASVVEIAVGAGTGPAELALQLHHEAYGSIPSEMSSKLEVLATIERAMEAILERGLFIVFRNIQHWIDGEQGIEEPLRTIIRKAATMDVTSSNPVFVTSTRRPRLPFDLARCTSGSWINGLSDNHMASLLSLWFELSEGSKLDSRSASEVAAKLHGHPVAAKLAAYLVAQHGATHLLGYPRELVALRRDLGKTLIRDLNLRESTCDLMELLAIIEVPIPSRILAEALKRDTDTFMDAVADATCTGIVETTDSGNLSVHPLVAEYFWRSHLDHEDYIQRAETASSVLHSYLHELPPDSHAFVMLLPAVFRLYTLSGRWEEARKIRGDLMGEMSKAAITHYNRRQYELAETLIEYVLADDPQHRKMRQYLARIRIRQQRWSDADRLIDQLLAEWPRDLGIRHLSGWRLLHERNYEGALQVFIQVLSEWEHVASLRDGAECLYRLGRTTEALDFLSRAKVIDADNPYALDLEAKIYEDMEEFELALAAARVAVVRNPGRWGLHHRLSRIFDALGQRRDAIVEAREAVRLDPAQFSARSALASLLIDDGNPDEARTHLDRLKRLSVGQTQRQVAAHLEARTLYKSGDLDGALGIVDQQIRKKANLAAIYGLLAEIRLTQYRQVRDRSSATAQIILQQAKTAVANCRDQPDHDAGVVETLQASIEGVGD